MSDGFQAIAKALCSPLETDACNFFSTQYDSKGRQITKKNLLHQKKLKVFKFLLS
jgi:hypothetical protein